MQQLTAAGALSRYADPFAGGAHRTVAELLGHHWSVPLEPDDVFFTHGGTEAINLTVAYLAAAGAHLVLPLPNYYAFDQAAARWNAPVTAYYRHDGHLHRNHETVGPTAVVEVLPNGITGRFHSTPRSLEPDFTLLDVVVQSGSLKDRCSPTAALRDRVQKLDLHHCAIIMTASKDLSLPGLRAAAVVTKNRGLQAHLAHDAFDRTAASNPLGSVLMAVYASLLPMFDAPAEHITKLVETSQDAASANALPALPTSADYRNLLRHLSAMTRRCRNNAALLRKPDSPLTLTSATSPEAGYSAFPSLATRQRDFLSWTNAVGRGGLRLNPTVVHGGTASAWENLYPDQLLRINLSEQPDRFAWGLEQIRKHCESQDHTRSPRKPSPRTPPPGSLRKPDQEGV